MDNSKKLLLKIISTIFISLVITALSFIISNPFFGSSIYTNRGFPLYYYREASLPKVVPKNSKEGMIFSLFLLDMFIWFPGSYYISNNIVNRIADKKNVNNSKTWRRTTI